MRGVRKLERNSFISSLVFFCSTKKQQRIKYEDMTEESEKWANEYTKKLSESEKAQKQACGDATAEGLCGCVVV